MRLLVAIINDPDNIDSILDEFYELGVKGATVVDSTGMAHIMADRVPFFARFSNLGEENPSGNKTIYVLLNSDEVLKKAVEAIERVTGDLRRPDTGVVFTVPVDFCKGLEKEE
jgi:nitrogen regulatory protein PII